MTLAERDTRRAFIDNDGTVVPLGEMLPAVSIEQAEAWLPAAKETLDRLKRFVGFLEDVVATGWKARGQREGLIGGLRYESKAKPGAWQYDASGLLEALRPFVGRVITEAELVDATGFEVIPARVIPETVIYDVKTVKVDALARRSDELASAINAHRSREEGEPKLALKK